jgi:hypothetical protein
MVVMNNLLAVIPDRITCRLKNWWQSFLRGEENRLQRTRPRMHMGQNVSHESIT